MAKYREEYFEADRVYVLLGKNVRDLRKRCRLTQVELAEKIECDQKQISRIELGLAHPFGRVSETGKCLWCICRYDENYSGFYFA